MNLDTIKYILERPGRIVSALGSKGLLNWVPDRTYLSLVFRVNLGYWPDLDEPKTFNEKLNWLKLYDRKPEYTRMVDKYAVREYIAEEIGEEYLIPLVGGPWNGVEEIDFDALPEQFVLKTTHDSGGVVICRDKASLDIEAARRKLQKRFARNYYWSGREWPYKNVKPRIIAEKYMEDEKLSELRDYKFYCFNGKAKAMLVVTDRAEKTPTRFTYFDMNFEVMELNRPEVRDPRPIARPESFEEMKALAAKLSEGLHQVRVDLYEVSGKIYFGELTFWDTSGYHHFDPVEWDRILGDWIELPEKSEPSV